MWRSLLQQKPSNANGNGGAEVPSSNITFTSELLTSWFSNAFTSASVPTEKHNVVVVQSTFQLQCDKQYAIHLRNYWSTILQTFSIKAERGLSAYSCCCEETSQVFLDASESTSRNASVSGVQTHACRWIRWQRNHSLLPLSVSRSAALRSKRKDIFLCQRLNDNGRLSARGAK